MELVQGDITQIPSDAIVNAANSSLLGGGGVDGAIHRAGGSAILEACRKIRARQGSCATGEAVYTTAGHLPAKWVIHTVGPVWQGGNKNEAQLLSNCYENSLRIAADLQVEHIAFPNISTGIYRFPKELAAQIAVQSVKATLPTLNSKMKVIFVCFDSENHQHYQSLLH